MCTEDPVQPKLNKENYFKIIFKKKIILNCLGGLNVITKFLKSGKGTIKEGFRETWYKMDLIHHCWLWRGGRGHDPMSAGSLKKLQEARKEFSPRASRKECSPSNTQILALRHRCQTSDLQNCKIINGCFPDGLDKESALVKNLSKKSACNAGDLGLIPGLGRSLGERNGKPLQYSYLEKSHEQRGLVGYSPWDCKEWDMTEQITLLLTHWVHGNLW